MRRSPRGWRRPETDAVRTPSKRRRRPEKDSDQGDGMASKLSSGNFLQPTSGPGQLTTDFLQPTSGLRQLETDFLQPTSGLRQLETDLFQPTSGRGRPRTDFFQPTTGSDRDGCDFYRLTSELSRITPGRDSWTGGESRPSAWQNSPGSGRAAFGRVRRGATENGIRDASREAAEPAFSLRSPARCNW